MKEGLLNYFDKRVMACFGEETGFPLSDTLLCVLNNSFKLRFGRVGITEENSKIAPLNSCLGSY